MRQQGNKRQRNYEENILISNGTVNRTSRKGFAYFVECKNGLVVREDYDLIKNTKSKSFTLEIKKNGNNVVFVVNGEETLDLDQVDVLTNNVGVFVKGKAEVAFDNMIIKQ